MQLKPWFLPSIALLGLVIWLPESDSFVYRKTVQGGHVFVLVYADARTGKWHVSESSSPI